MEKNLIELQQALEKGENLNINKDVLEIPKMMSKPKSHAKRHLNPMFKFYVRNVLGVMTFARLLLTVFQEERIVTINEFVNITFLLCSFTLIQAICAKKDGSNEITFVATVLSAFFILGSTFLILAEIV